MTRPRSAVSIASLATGGTIISIIHFPPHISRFSTSSIRPDLSLAALAGFRRGAKAAKYSSRFTARSAILPACYRHLPAASTGASPKPHAGECAYDVGVPNRVLDARREKQLAEARSVLGALIARLAEFGASTADQTALTSSLRQLDDLFLLVVVGEFNAGKSAFINALLGERVLDEGVTPTTARIHLLTYGDAPSRTVDAEGMQVVAAPVELLRDIHVVDTPGTNAIVREHERLTTEFVPRCDLVLFVTSAERPFTETERAFLQTIRGWGKKVVIIVNKVDILEQAAEREQVVAFVDEAAGQLLGTSPEIFPVSARRALRAKQEGLASLAESGFDVLERYIVETLDERQRFRLKLANPLGIGQALASRYVGIAKERLALLADDLSLLADIERQLVTYRDDVERGFELRMTAVEKVLVDMEARGHRFFEDTLRVGRVVDLLNRSRVQREFEERVVADAPRQIEQRVTELIDWLVDQEFRQWQAVTTRLTDRQRHHESRLLGSPDIGSFHSDRARWIETVGRESQRVVETYDRQQEAESIADQARSAVATAAAAGGAAVGLGTLVSIAASTAAADITGIVMAGVLATVGFLVIPARRRRAKHELQEKISDLRDRLAEALRTEFEHARAKSGERLENTIAPYARFVRTEERRWAAAGDDLTALGDKISALLAEIGAES